MIFVNEQKIDIISNAGFCGNSTKFLTLLWTRKGPKIQKFSNFQKKLWKKKSYQKWPKLKNCYFLPQHHKVLLFIAGLRIWVLAFSVLFLTKDQPHLNNAKWCRVKICNSAWFWHHLKIASFRSCTTTSKRSSSITSKTSLCIHGWI